MAELQSIDSDYTNLTSDTNLTSSEGLKSLYRSPSTSSPSSTIPISTLSPTDRDLISQASTSSQDLQRNITDIQKPNVGIMLLLGALGGPNAVNEYYARSMQKQVEPIVGSINLQYRQALNAGDFTKAQTLVNQLAPMVQYSPTAGKLYENFTNEIAKRQDNVQQNRIFIGGLLKTGLVKEGSPYYNYLIKYKIFI